MTDTRKSVDSKEILENENPNKVTDTVKKIFDFNKQQKRRRRPLDLAKCLKLLNPKNMF